MRADSDITCGSLVSLEGLRSGELQRRVMGPKGTAEAESYVPGPRLMPA